MMILQQTRGALSSGDQLALDLPFAETKSLAARIGPSPTFTRGSGATYVGSDGLIHGVDTSTSSNSISIGSKSFTLAATAGQDQLYRTGDAVDASNGSNSMVGTVTSYTPSTQVLVCNITSVTGSGTFSSWRIGYRGPRFDHDPANPTICRGLLIEEGRTNSLVRSGELRNTTSWFTVASTQNSSSEVAPDGGTTAVSLVEDSTNQNHFIYQNISLGSAAYTYSIFAKAGSRNWIYVDIFNGTLSPVSNGAYFNLSNGTIGNIDSGVTASITSHSNGWYRCSVTSTRAVASAVIRMASANGTSAYLGNGTGNVLLWGAQLEAGSFATSYIPTTTSALARSADVCSISGAAFTGLWAGEATVLFSGMRYQASATFANRSWALHAGTQATEMSASKFGTQELLGFAGSNILSTGTIIPAFQQFKTAHAIKATDYAGSQNGLATITSNNATSLTPNAFNIGSGFLNTGQLNGTISAIRYYKKRLANAKLVTLTV